MSAHTPGTWRRGVANDGYFIATGALIPDIAQRITSEADAALIEAAPDLLEALNLLTDFADHASSLDYNEDKTLSWIAVVTAKARAAIAKATGGQL